MFASNLGELVRAERVFQALVHPVFCCGGDCGHKTATEPLKLRFYRDSIVTKIGVSLELGVPLGENFEPRVFSNLGQMADLRRLVVSLS
jgi:hypothetical protein